MHQRSRDPVPGSATIELVEVAKAFGAFKAVDGVSLSVPAGQTAGLVGPNGAGKTTLLGLISGGHRVTSGRVRLHGADVTRVRSLGRARLGIARTFQTARIFPALTVAEHLLLAAPDHDGWGPGWARSRIALHPTTAQRLDAIAGDYGLGDVLYVPASSLPQAQRKILDLAVALLRQPSLLLLDEPTAGVAAEDLAVITGMLGQLRERHPDLAVILTSHDADLIARLCQRIIVLVRGTVLADGPTDEVIEDARVRAAYFGDVLGV